MKIFWFLSRRIQRPSKRQTRTLQGLESPVSRLEFILILKATAFYQRTHVQKRKKKNDRKLYTRLPSNLFRTIYIHLCTSTSRPERWLRAHQSILYPRVSQRKLLLCVANLLLFEMPKMYPEREERSDSSIPRLINKRQFVHMYKMVWG